MSNYIVVSLNIRKDEPELYEWLKARAEREQRSMSNLIAMILSQEYNREKAANEYTGPTFEPV